jgi:hypothetical protein
MAVGLTVKITKNNSTIIHPRTAVEGYPSIDGGVCAPGGFEVAGIRCGIKRKRRDIALLVCSTGQDAVCAGVFTQNVVRAPSVDRNVAVLQESPFIRAVVVNAGNANAGNGQKGEDDNATMAGLAAPGARRGSRGDSDRFDGRDRDCAADGAADGRDSRSGEGAGIEQ